MKLVITILFTTFLALSNLLAKPGVCNHGLPTRVGVITETLTTNPLPHINYRNPYVHKNRNSGNYNFDEAPIEIRNYQLDMKILFLSATADSKIEPSIKTALQTLSNMGIPYEHVVLTQDHTKDLSTKLSLYNSDGSGKYYGIITSTGQLVYQDRNGIYKSALSDAEWSLLNEYERKFKVRRVSLYTYPTLSLGVKVLDKGDYIQNRELTITDPTLQVGTGIKSNVTLPVSNVLQYPAKVINPQVAKPIFNFAIPSNSVAGIIASFSDKREQMHFFFAQSIYSKTSMVLAPLWVQWLTRGVYVGKKRIYLNVQIDDVFLSTELWNLNKKEFYRITKDDLSEFIDHEKSFLRPETDNSNFRIELAFNGQGTHYFGGQNRDHLYIFSKENLEEFYWVSHTFSHPDLDRTSYIDAKIDIENNELLANKLFSSDKYYSPLSMVTPKISGLFSRDALNAIAAQNKLYVVGDNSRPELTPTQPNVGRYTTESFNGRDGVLIIPRNPTEIYYNVSLPEELISEYNHFYSDFFKRESTFTEIYERESDRVSNNLLSFNYSPYMFHQANLRKFNLDGKPTSLVSHWTDLVVSEVRKYSELPILNAKMDDLAKIYLERMDFENCGFHAKMVVENNGLEKILIDSLANCVATISGIDVHSTFNPSVSEEVYGTENSVKINLKGKPTTLNLATPVLMY